MKYKIIFLIFTICLISSTILFFAKPLNICAENQGCSIVQSSKYASIFGIPNSLFGIIIFTSLLILIFLHIKNPTKLKKQIIYSGIIISSIVAVYFIYLQHFILKAYCKYCMITDISLIIGLLILIFTWRK